MNYKRKILFICHGNICRSPMAEFVMKSLTNDYYIESAATTTEEIGNPIYPPAKEQLIKHKITGFNDKTARKVTIDDYEKFDYLIIMDEENRHGLKRIINDDNDNKIRKLLDKDISDPWYTRDFDLCFDEIYRGCIELLKSFEEK